jgi:hypothetical protein
MADTMSELAVCLEATGELVEATAWGARAAAMRVVTQGQ